MSTYGRNFDFRVTPEGGERGGRFSLAAVDQTGAAVTSVPIGAPVVAYDDNGDAIGEDALGRTKVALAVTDQAIPKGGLGGVLVYEYAPAAYAGYDPESTTYSDLDTVAAGQAVQVVFGQTAKVVLKNTEDSTFLTLRSYSGRTMVANIGTAATPTIVVGNYLTPHDSPSDSNGYWQKTTDATEAWLVVTGIDYSRGEVEARLNL